jgi:hypothetical protein
VLGVSAAGFSATPCTWDGRCSSALFLVPTVVYGSRFLRTALSEVEASAKGLSVGEMLQDVGILGAAVACYLLVLFCQKALHFPDIAAWPRAGVILLAVGAL